MISIVMYYFCKKRILCQKKNLSTIPGGMVHVIIVFFTTPSQSKGVSILMSSKFHFKLLNQHRSADGRIIVLNIVNNETITLVNIYAPVTIFYCMIVYLYS